MLPFPRQRAFALLGLLAGIIVATTRALAFAPMGFTWPAGTDIVMHLSLSRAPASFPDGSTSWNASAADALQIWNQHLDTVRFVEAGASASGKRDGRNSVFFAGNVYGEGFGTNTIAVTVGFNDASSPTTIVETDVIFNSAERWNSYRGPQQADSRGNPVFDLHRVALHEFGHVLGIDHPDAHGQTVHALMNSTTGDTDAITADDIAGAQHLYGFRVTSALTVPNVQSGQEFRYQIAANREVLSYEALNLPAALQLDSATGLITGSVNAAGTYVIDLRVHGRTGTALARLTITVVPLPLTSSSNPRDVEIGSPFSYQITSSNRPFWFTADGLPPGVQLDSNTGTISGVPTISGQYRIRVTARGETAEAAGTIYLNVLAAPDATLPLRTIQLLNAGLIVADSHRPRFYLLGGNGVMVLDARSFSVVHSVAMPYGVTDISISADGTTLWMTGYYSREIKRLNLDTLEFLPNLVTEHQPKSIREGADRRLYISDGQQPGIFQIDPNTGSTIAKVSASDPSEPIAGVIEVSPNRKALYVAPLIPAPRLWRFDIGSGAVPALLDRSEPAGPRSHGSRLAASADGRFVAFTTRSFEYGKYDPVLLFPANDLAAAPIKLTAPGDAEHLTFSRDGSRLFVGVPNNSMINVFDTASGQLVRTITLPDRARPSALLVDPTNTELVVPSFHPAAGSVVYTYRAVPPPAPPAPPRSLLNVSTRLRAQPGADALIGGFILSGTQPKKLLLRALGPSLPLPHTLADPLLELRDAAGSVVAENDNWNSHRTAVLATSAAPPQERESAIVVTLQPGSYTAVITGNGNTSGVALVEAYDLEPANSRIVNISTRGKVETQGNVMIGGFIIGGGGAARMMVRAVGPSLAASGVPGALDDPTLELYDGNGSLLALNDDWRTDEQDEIASTTIPPHDDRESAVLRTLEPGNYTAIVRGKNDTTGVALVEVYNLEKE